MSAMEDALRKAGFEVPESAEPKPAEPKEGGEAKDGGAPAGEKACAKCATMFTPAHPRHRLCPKCVAERPERPPRPPAEARPAARAEPEEKKCARCGTAFTPHSPKHRLCPKCADEHFSAKPEAPLAVESRPEAPRPALPARRRERDYEGRAFPDDYLARGYFAPDGQVRAELYGGWARQVAEALVGRKMPGHQLRAFHNHVRRADAVFRATRDFAKVREAILRMPAYAAERHGRGRVPGEFREFLDRNVEHVRDAASFHAFVEHFQAVVGYAAGRLKN